MEIIAGEAEDEFDLFDFMNSERAWFAKTANVDIFNVSTACTSSSVPPMCARNTQQSRFIRTREFQV